MHQERGASDDSGKPQHGTSQGGEGGGGGACHARLGTDSEELGRSLWPTDLAAVPELPAWQLELLRGYNFNANNSKTIVVKPKKHQLAAGQLSELSQGQTVRATTVRLERNEAWRQSQGRAWGMHRSRGARVGPTDVTARHRPPPEELSPFLPLSSMAEQPVRGGRRVDPPAIDQGSHRCERWVALASRCECLWKGTAAVQLPVSAGVPFTFPPLWEGVPPSTCRSTLPHPHPQPRM